MQLELRTFCARPALAAAVTIPHTHTQSDTDIPRGIVVIHFRAEFRLEQVTEKSRLVLEEFYLIFLNEKLEQRSS